MHKWRSGYTVVASEPHLKRPADSSSSVCSDQITGLDVFAVISASRPTCTESNPLFRRKCCLRNADISERAQSDPVSCFVLCSCSKRPRERKFELKPNTVKRGYLVSSLKRWKSASVPSTELSIVWRFTKATLPKIEFKAASPDWVTMYLLCCCQVFYCVHVGFKSEQSPLQLNCGLTGERKGTAEMYREIFLLCIL